MTKKIKTPHDRFFGAAFKQPQFVREFCQQHLPERLLEVARLETAEVVSGRFIKHDLGLKEADVLIKLQFLEQTGYLVLLFEHQSTPDKFMVYRGLEYTVLKMMEHYQNHGKQLLPLIVPIVYYSGQTPWPHSLDLSDCLNAPSTLAEEFAIRPYLHLVDLTQIPDGELMRYQWSGLAGWLMKHAKDSDIVNTLECYWVDKMKDMEQQGALNYLCQAFSYIINTNDENKAPLETLIHSQFTPDLEETIMTMAQQYRQEGMERGIEIGKKEAAEKTSTLIAKRLLSQNMSPEQIAALTDLSAAKIKALLKSKNG